MRCSGRASVVVVWLSLILPHAVWAQQAAGLAGIVRDSSGASLPGVTVEAASPVLIEKRRTAITDAEGRYSVVDLRPGSYTMTFTLIGFSTVKREGIELTAGFTATVNTDLSIGALEETITVSGASPLVDIQNVQQQKVVSNELLATLPTSTKALSTLITLTPGMSGAPDVGGASGIYRSNAPRLNTFHGKASIKFAYDGMNAMNFGAVGATAYVINPATVEEMVVGTGGVSAESEASGIMMNMIPKEGGNTYRGSISGFYTNDHLQSDNLTDDLRGRGLTSPNRVLRLYDFNVTVGGPVKKDKLWFFTAPRLAGNKNDVPGVFFNLTQGTSFYTPDVNRPAYREEHLRAVAARLTWQASAKNKINGFVDIQSMALRGRGDFVAPEALAGFLFWPQGLAQVTWSSPRTNKLLLDAGASLMNTTYPAPRDPNTKPTDITIVESSTGFRYNASANYNTEYHSRIVQRFSASYVTGTHSFKGGIQVTEGFHDIATRYNGALAYTFLRGAPSSLTQYSTPYRTKMRVMPDLGLFVQDKWAMRRLTLNYGVRFDYFDAFVPAQHVDPTPFVPGARDFARLSNVPHWTDLNPRVGGSYDMFGNGRTALKASLGRYVGAASSYLALLNNPITTSVNSVTRTWNDVNGNYVPDCNLLDPVANTECGAISNTNFGKSNITTRYADDILNGFGVRDYLWDVSAEVQHQVSRGLSVTAGYYRNWSNHFSTNGIFDAGATNNLLVEPGDFDPYCVTAPRDARLPGGGGYRVCGLYDVVPSKFGQVNNVITRADGFGGERLVNNFVGLTMNGRFKPGMELGGGLDTGQMVTDKCFLVDSPQQLLNCHVVSPFKAQTQVKVFGSYPLPAQFGLSATFQNVAGPEIQANYTASNAEIASSLGRNLAACRGAAECTATAAVPLLPPQTLFEKRRTILDVRLSKRLAFGAARLQANLDIYNVLNSSAVLSVNGTFGPRWQFPVGTNGNEPILWGRMLQLGGQLTF
jgi:hypothetical protein